MLGVYESKCRSVENLIPFRHIKLGQTGGHMDIHKIQKVNINPDINMVVGWHIYLLYLVQVIRYQLGYFQVNGKLVCSPIGLWLNLSAQRFVSCILTDFLSISSKPCHFFNFGARKMFFTIQSDSAITMFYM